MTRNEIINEINCLLSELDNGDDAVSYLTQNDVNWLKENIKALEQEQDKPMVEIDLYSVIKQKYIEREVFDKIRAEIEKEAFTDVNNSKFISVNRVYQIFDKYKAESEGKE